MKHPRENLIWRVTDQLDIASLIDHIFLKSDATYEDIWKACEETREYRIGASASVRIVEEVRHESANVPPRNPRHLPTNGDESNYGIESSERQRNPPIC